MTDYALGERIEIFFGEISAAEARVYVRAPLIAEFAGASIRGAVRGPKSRYAHTLTAAVPLRATAGGDALLAQAIVPDPCFWTPDAPYLYDVAVEISRDTQVIAATNRELGLRPLGMLAGNLRLEGRNFVLRAVHADTLPLGDLGSWHESETALVLANPGDTICAAASHAGVLVVAEVSASREDLVVELRRLSRHAAVGMIILEDVDQRQSSAIDALNPRSIARNVVFARRPALGEPPVAFAHPDWAQAIVVAADDLDHQLAPLVAASKERPCILAERRADMIATPSEGRALCDRLQRDLALRSEETTLGPLAGYIV